MKTTVQTLKSATLAFSICLGVLAFQNCSNDDDGDNTPKETNCEEHECLNGGEAIYDIELETCRCICPTGYTGDRCETAYCPANIECPSGQEPNPANHCKCE